MDKIVPETHQIVSRAEWIEARKKLLVKEKEITRKRDALAAERRQFPWVRMDKPYLFESASGKVTLGELFAGRSQLAIYHFMFGPDWEEGCTSCSMVADHIDPAVIHLAQRDVTLILASRAPWQTLDAFRKRMGWKINWVSTLGSDFNFDFGVSFPTDDLTSGRRTYNYGSAVPFSEETGGVSVFFKDDQNQVFHTYSTYGRGCEPMQVPYYFLDMVPKGRNEEGLPYSTAWARLHDRYDPV